MLAMASYHYVYNNKITKLNGYMYELIDTKQIEGVVIYHPKSTRSY